MTARQSLEEALEFLLNEDEEKANVAFHNFIVKSAQAIHESFIAEDDLDNDIDENDENEEVDESKDEDVDESKKEEVDESKDDEEVDESKKKEVDEGILDRGVATDEYFGRDELSANPMEDDEDDYDNGMDMGGDDAAAADLGDEMGGEGEEVVLAPDDVVELRASLDDLTAKFDALTGGEEEMDYDNGDMGDNGDMDYAGGDNGMDYEEPAEEGMRFESKDEDLDEKDDSEEVDEAITHEPGVVKPGLAKTDHYGNHGSKDSLLSNPDARLPEGASEFDFDLTEEDFLDLEEGLKQVDVKMGGEQGGGKFAGEETQTKSPVAQRDKSDVRAGSKDMISTRDDHGGYSRESEPGSGKLPHSEDNSKDKASTPTSVGTGGGLEKQKGYGEGEVGAGKFAGTETNVKSIIGSAGTRNES